MPLLYKKIHALCMVKHSNRIQCQYLLPVMGLGFVIVISLCSRYYVNTNIKRALLYACYCIDYSTWKHADKHIYLISEYSAGNIFYVIYPRSNEERFTIFLFEYITRIGGKFFNLDETDEKFIKYKISIFNKLINSTNKLRYFWFDLRRDISTLFLIGSNTRSVFWRS